jgi:pre-mRNA-splicing factor CDC5/CEF1
MVRVFIKGGVWKNSEDEILKAAVMKYGKQQWARVASLLNRKSAKQCKARWNEWLDPSVKKVEWSRAEDEKLLHLAKLLPAQWKTIAPLLGRTATQCQDRYERLLDEAAAAASGEGTGDGGAEEDGKPHALPDGVAAAGGGGGVASAARKLRPGEIDPHPETKPARPDPIDMDEDEIEMLQEARARLANTQGKKAKRKQREKLLAEAKRLADLQKRRELKAAGLLSGEMSKRARTKKRQREIDFGVEIPFHKPAPAGFHDVSDEKSQTEAARAKRLKDINYHKINEDQYRSRDREAKFAQKKEENRLRNLERSNMQLAVATVAAKSDPTSVRNRSALSMPSPKMTEAELSEAAKVARKGAIVAEAGGSSGGVTDALLGDYSKSDSSILPASMRAPSSTAGASTASSSERINREAQNLLRLERGETPLLGGVNAELNAGGAGTGASLGPSGPRDDASTLATVTTGATATTAAASTVNASTSARSSTTIIRDQLGLNAASASSNASHAQPSHYTVDETASFVGSTLASTATGMLTGKAWRERAREERRAAKRARRELEEALAALPAPQFEYELAVPNSSAAVTDDDDEARRGGARDDMEMDQADVEAEEQRELERKAAKLYEIQSSVLKRSAFLPRPSAAALRPDSNNLSMWAADAVPSDDGSRENGTAEAITRIREETVRLMSHDAIAHPPLTLDEDKTGGGLTNKKKSKKNKGASLANFKVEPLEYFTEDALATAKELLAAETVMVMTSARDEAVAASSEVLDIHDVDATLAKANVQCSTAAAGKHDKEGRIAEMRVEFEALEGIVKAVKKRNDKLEQKLAIQNGGYAKRCQGLVQLYDEANAATCVAEIEVSVYSQLTTQEREAIVSRLSSISDTVAELEQREASVQQKYGTLLHGRNRFLKRLKTT